MGDNSDIQKPLAFNLWNVEHANINNSIFIN